MVARARSVDRRNDWLNGCSIDDQLWHQSMVSYFNQMDHASDELNYSPDEKVLRILLARGVLDMDEFDKVWDGATRSMRYSAVMMDRMLTMFQEEQKRVSIPAPFHFWKLTRMFRLTVSSKR